MPPQGTREDFLALKHVGRFLGLNISEERVQSGKPMVSRTRRRLSFLLQVIAECFDQYANYVVFSEGRVMKDIREERTWIKASLPAGRN